MITTAAPSAFPTERDRLRAIFLGRDLTGDISIDQETRRLADDYVGTLMHGAEMLGYSLAWVQTIEDLSRAEQELQQKSLDLFDALEALERVVG